MANIKNIIDSELIIRKISNSLNEKEEYIFQQWYDESIEHQEYFEHAKRYFEQGSAFDKTTLDTQLAWDNVKPPVPISKNATKNRYTRVGIFIAAVISLLLATFFVFKPMKNEVPVPALSEKVDKILPGKSKAILVLDDGREYELSKGKEVSLKSGKTVINSEGTKIKYTSNEVEHTKLLYNTLIIPKGGEYYLELSDGTKVWLNAETKLKYPVQFIGAERNVELTGEAYFEVAHNESKPFHVVSGGQSIEVLGTEFNVSAYKDDLNIVTTLVKGKVSVYETHTKDNNQLLKPNDQTIMNRRSGEITSKVVDPKNFIAWKSGAFYFQDKTFDGMMKVLSRWYDINVFYDNEDVRDIKFTGRFKRYDDFETVKQLIQKTDEVKFEIKGKTVVIK